jgi:hypothetical protein
MPLLVSRVEEKHMGGQQTNFISDIVFFQHQDGMRKKFDGIFYSVSTTLVKLVAKFAAGVVENSGKFAPGDVDTGGKFATGVFDTGGAP